MFTVINGLPAHILLIHAIVVLAPLGALFTILSATWPTARRRIGIFGPVTCLIVLVLTPITTHAGEWLEHKLTTNGPNAAIEKHANLGDTFLFFAIGLFVVSAAVWWVGRGLDRAAGSGDRAAAAGGSTLTRPRTAVPVVVAYAVQAVAVLVSIAVVVQLVRIGDSGSKASWDFVQKLP